MQVPVEVQVEDSLLRIPSPATGSDALSAMQPPVQARSILHAWLSLAQVVASQVGAFPCGFSRVPGTIPTT